MTDKSVLSECSGFDWDAGNLTKNWVRHRVSAVECEEVFFNEPLVVADDQGHSFHEPRLYALGRTAAGRELFLVFTVRGTKIRVISARDMHRKERKEYEQS